MLILERRLDEAVLLRLPSGDTVRVMVTKFRGGWRVRLGIDAPLSVVVLRAELEDEATELEGE